MSVSSSIKNPTTLTGVIGQNKPIQDVTDSPKTDLSTPTSFPSLSQIESCSDTSDPVPTKRRGRPQKWRRLTRDDRQVAKSLHQLENDDLSIHLYNAHAIKKEACPRVTSTNGTGANVSAEREGRWNDSERWRPGDDWTAWPLTPVEVPKYWETFYSNAEFGSISRHVDGAKKDLRPSAEMQDVLITGMLSSSVNDLPESQIDFQGFDAASSNQNLNDPRAEDDAQTHEFQRGGVALLQEQGANLESECNGSLDELEESSFVRDSSQSSNNDGYVELRLNSPCSDETAAQNLRPTVLHMVQSIDELLMALHYSRQNHVNPKPHVHGLSSSQESSLSDNSFRQNSAKHVRSDSTPKRRYRRDERGLRDWSEILGTASLIGWNSRALQRTTERCSSLFGEQMLFNLMEEEQPSDLYSTKDHDTLKPDHGLECEKSPASTRTREKTKPVGWICPEKACKRHKTPIIRRHHWLLHIKKKHGYDYTGPELLSRPSESVQWELAQYVRYCPDSQCSRSKKPYRERWRLREHIKIKHGVRVPSLSRNRSRGSTAQSSSSQGSVEDDNRNQTIGSIHIDGFLKPVSLGVLESTLEPTSKKTKSNDASRVGGSGKHEKAQLVTGSSCI